jgi:glycosyltransferase involved in cell wall biosynthesis
MARVQRSLVRRSILPLVSVVIPVHNKRAHLPTCLDSVLSQTGVDIEVLCIDDCSTDGSAEFLLDAVKADSRIRVLINAVNAGAGASRNRGIDEARGAYIQFTDADDLLPSGALHALCAAASEMDAEVVRGGLAGYHDDRWRGAAAPGGSGIGPLLSFPDLWVPWFHTCFLISRELLVRHQIRYPSLSPGEDPVFLARVLTAAMRLCVIPDVTYTYRGSAHRPQRTFRHMEDYVTHAEVVRDIYGDAHRTCWQVYRAFIAQDIANELGRASLTGDERQDLERRLRGL